MHRKKIHMLVLAGGFLLGGMVFGSTAEAGPTAAAMANTCAGCHGTNGVSAGPAMPSIAGMQSTYMTFIMQEFKDGTRPSTIMGRIAKGYTEEQTKAMADFFAKQKWVNAKSHPNSKLATKINRKLAKKGKRLAKKCKNCHGRTGVQEDDDEDTPRVAGQWLDYLLFKMEDLKNTGMKVPQPKKMAKKVGKMSLKDLKAVAHFYAKQKK